MKRKLVFVAVLVALLPVACENTPTTDPTQADPQFSSSSYGLHLRDRDTSQPMPSDTTVGVQDTIRLALSTRNGNGPQNNRNVKWSSSDPAVAGITSDRGTAVVYAQALGTSVICAKLGGNSYCVTIHVTAGSVAEIVLTTPSSTVLGGSTITVTAQLRDQSSNPVLVPGIEVYWSSTNGGTFSDSPTLTDANGQTAVDFTVADNGGVTHDITATVGAASGMIQVSTFNNPPTAGDDVFDAIGNSTIPVNAPGVLANDSDSEGTVAAVPEVITTANGGTVNLSADGSFTYLSSPGFTGTDSWSYTVTDGTLTATGSVSMNVPTRVWFVKNDGVAPGDGRDASPFVTLSAAQTASAVSEQIYVYRGDGTSSGYDAGFVFKNGQSVIGQGSATPVTAVLNEQVITLFAADGNAPKVARETAGTTFQLAQNNTLLGIAVASTAGAAIGGNTFGTLVVNETSVTADGGPALNLVNGSVTATISTLSSSMSSGTGVTLTDVSGSIDAPAGTITGSAGTGFHISGGAASVSYGGKITASNGMPVHVVNRTGGTVEFTGAITSLHSGITATDNTNAALRFTGTKLLATGSNPAVTLSNNTGSTIEFSGGALSISTSGAPGFSANQSGTLTVTGASNWIDANGAIALDVQNTNVGTAGLNFENISANNAANGIVLVNTGSNPALTVTGNGSPGSGGSIQNISGPDGQQAGNGVLLSGVAGVSLSHMQLSDHTNHAIRGANVNGFALISSTVNGTNGDNAALNEGAIVFDVLTGQAEIRNSTIAGGLTDNIRIMNTSGVLDRLSVLGSTVGLNSIASGRHGLFVIAAGGTANMTVQSSKFLGARGSLLLAQTQGGGVADVVLTTSTFNNSHTNTVPGGGNVVVDGSGSGFNITYAISGNTFQNALGSALAVGTTGAGNITGTIHNNEVGLALVANSGSAQGAGLSITVNGGAKHTTVLTGNRVRQYNNQGVLLQIGDNLLGGDGELNATLTGNTISNPGTVVGAKNGIHLNAGTITGDNPKVCLVIGGAGALANSITGSGSGGAAGTDFRLRQRMLTTVVLPGYIGANNDAGAVTLFVQNNNPFATGLTQHTVPTGGGFIDGPACPTM